MEMARVVGSVSATLKDGSLQGLKLALVQAVDEHGAAVRPAEVAVDTQSVGIGELVLTVRGSAARQPEMARGVAADLTIVAIVDEVRPAASSASSASSIAAAPPERRSRATKPSRNASKT
jgi:microcompartment protein CcmK/EutM